MTTTEQSKRTEQPRIADLRLAMTMIERAHRVKETLDEACAAYTFVTLHHLAVMAEVRRAKGRATVSELATVFNRAVHTMTSAIDRLDKHHLTTRYTVNGEDRRIIRIRLTGRGDEVLDKVRSASADILDQAFAGDVLTLPVSQAAVEAYVRAFTEVTQ